MLKKSHLEINIIWQNNLQQLQFDIFFFNCFVMKNVIALMSNKKSQFLIPFNVSNLIAITNTKIWKTIFNFFVSECSHDQNKLKSVGVKFAEYGGCRRISYPNDLIYRYAFPWLILDTVVFVV